MIRLIFLMVFVVWGPVWAAADGGVPFPSQNAEGSYMAPSLNQGIDKLSASLTQQIAARYFDAEKRPVIKVAVFDFTDEAGNITVGSRYVCNRIRLAFGDSPQFDLVLPQNQFKKVAIFGAEEFGKSKAFREHVVGEMKADVYVLGRIDASDATRVFCEVDIWGIMPPYDNFSHIADLSKLEEKEKAIAEDVLWPRPWRMRFSSSGLDFFTQVLVPKSDQGEAALQENIAEVIFLSQPMCDDLNLSWQVKADGMVYDVRKENEAGTLRSRTGQIMQSRVKSLDALKELSYVIRDVGLVVKDSDGLARPLEFYILPKKSSFYFVPYQEGETGLRFMYVWANRGLSKAPSSHESGKGWKLYVADQDYKNIMPLGTYTATATIAPVAESEYGSKKPRSEYVSRFKFAVLPGLNIYVINYVYRRDRPEIFVRRLEIEGSRDDPVEAVKRITEVYRVYGKE